MPNNFIKLLYPGIRLKRWLFTAFVGIVIIGFGVVCALSDYNFVKGFSFIIILCGMVFVVLGIGKMIVSLITIFLPKRERDLVNILYQRRFLEKGPKIVAIGGGHGLSHLLLSLKEYTSNLTAIVTVADSGGSSGRLREEFNIVAPGDIRNCLVALADAPALMGELFQFRFSADSQLQGHNFGNLFLTAMFQLTGGDFNKAVEESSKVLAIRGKVVPSTVTNVHLVAEYMDGSITHGEAKIPKPGVPIKRVFLNPDDAKPTKEALEAIDEADIIVMGPGSLYTSVIPNLIINGVSDAIAKSAAFKIYVCNVMTQLGETEGLSASDHLKAIIAHSNRDIINACILNNSPIPQEALERYKAENAYPVEADVDKIKEMGIRVHATDLISFKDYVRHDAQKLISALIKVIETHRVIRR
jgi:uncharacterized cofD-like protein